MATKEPKSKTDEWIRILEVLAAMPVEERVRCIAATATFFGLSREVFSQIAATDEFMRRIARR